MNETLICALIKQGWFAALVLHREPFSRVAKTWLGKGKDAERDSTPLSVHLGSISGI